MQHGDDGGTGTTGPARHRRAWIDVVLAVLLVAIAVFPLVAVATAAGAGERRPDPAVALAPLRRTPTGTVRSVPVLSPGAQVTPAQLQDPAALRAAIDAAAVQVLGAGPAGQVMGLVAAEEPLAASIPFDDRVHDVVYPFRYPPLDVVLDPVLGRDLRGDRARQVSDLAARLTLAAARFPDSFGSGGSVAFDLLDRARAGGCDPQLNLAALLTLDTVEYDDRVATEMAKARSACPGDPTPLWLLGQFQSVRALAAAPPTPQEGAAALLGRPTTTFHQLEDAFPGSAAGWSGEADTEMRLGYDTTVPQPFSARVRFRRALALYQRAEALDPDPGLILGEARALAALGRTAEAAAANRRALAKHPEAMVVQVRLVEQLERAQQFADAATEGGRLQSAPGTLPDGLSLIGRPSFIEGGFANPVLAEDADGPVSLGIDRLRPVSIVVGPPKGGAGGAVTDLSFLPTFHPVVGVTGFDRWCRDWSHRRDLVLAGKGAEALAGFPSAFADARGGADARACPGEVPDPAPGNLRAVALLETGDAAGAAAAASAADGDNAGGGGGGVNGATAAEEARSEGLRFAGDLARAAEVTDAWAAKDPSPLAADRQGEVAFLQGRFADAATAFGRAAASPDALDRAEEQLKQGTALERAGDLDGARAMLTQADAAASAQRDQLERSDKNCDFSDPCGPAAVRGAYISYNARLQHADTELRARNYDQAVTLYESARERATLVPHDNTTSLIRPEVLENNESLVEVERQHPAPALADADRALAADPANPIFLLNRGFALEKLGRFEDAAASYGAALDADPTLFPAANDLGVILARQHRLGEAERVLRQAVAANPRYALARFNLGVVLDREGPQHLLEAQGSLGWAAHLDSGLRGRSRELIFDDDAFVTTLDLCKPLPAVWHFASSQRRSSVGVAGVVVVLMLIRLVRALVLDQVAGKAQEKALDAARGGRLAWLGRAGAGLTPLLAVAATVALLVLPLVRAGGTTVTEELFVVVGVLALSLAYLRIRAAVARAEGVAVRHFTWGPAVVLGGAAAAFNLGFAPLPVADSADGTPTSLHWWGPGFLGGTAVILLLLGRGTGVPVLSALGGAALVMTSSVLMPVEPCDGAFLGGGWRALVPSVAVLALGILLFLGYL